MKRPILILLFATLCMLSGCGTRFIVSMPGTVGVLKKEIKGADVLLPDKTGELAPGKADLPAGTLIRVPEGEKK